MSLTALLFQTELIFSSRAAGVLQTFSHITTPERPGRVL